ncbi:MAG TPA: hypothetical protein EYP59_08220 [Thiotrichaceae bacterium]|nr:hypothetical protein [Thiotrichaceae bacterium]
MITTCSVPDILSRFHGTRIFVHAVTSISTPGINLTDEESHRALLLARAHDIVVVPSPIDADILDYYRTLGFKVDPHRIVVVAAGTGDMPLSERLLADASALERVASLLDDGPVGLDPFAVCDREVRLASHLGHFLGCPVTLLGTSLVVANMVNRKDTARRRALDIGVPVTPGEIVNDVLEADSALPDMHSLADAIRRQLATTGRVVVKGAIGDSGSAIFIVPDESAIDGVLQAIVKRRDNVIYQVEAFLDLACAPNVTVWIDPENDEISLVNTTDQRLSEKLVFSGSIFPTTAKRCSDIIEAAEVLARRLCSEGLHGWAGFDFGEYNDSSTGERQFFLSEINARYNGGLYAKALLDVLQAHQREHGHPIPAAYITENILTSPIDFTRLRALGEVLLFDQTTGYGVVPFNPGRLKEGKISVACLGSNISEAQQLAKEFRQRVST